MTEFEERMERVFAECQHELCRYSLKTNMHYKEINDKYNKLFADIEEKLGKKEENLMIELNNLDKEREGIESDLVYRQGLYDCVKLLKMIKMI